MVNAVQIRAARAGLGWTQGDLARASGVAERAVLNFEGGRTTPRDATLGRLTAALEKAGVDFTSDGSGFGVRFRRGS